MQLHHRQYKYAHHITGFSWSPMWLYMCVSGRLVFAQLVTLQTHVEHLTIITLINFKITTHIFLSCLPNHSLLIVHVYE